MKHTPYPINVPNTLTAIRILLTPLFVIFLLKQLSFFALLTFLLAAISDGLDGFIAKHYNQKTLLGAYLDPIADKLLIVSAFLCLAFLKLVPPWLTVIVLSRDVVISLGIAIFAITDIHVEINPSLISKCTTVFQISTILMILSDPSISGVFALKPMLLWCTAGLTIASGLHYLYVGLGTLQNALGKHPEKR